MPRTNDVVEALLGEYADLIAISGGDAFRSRTYEKAARSIGGYHADVATLDLKGLQEIPNVGKSTAEKILEYLATGQVGVVEDLRARIPAGVRELISIPTLGPKKAMVLYQDLRIASVEELSKAIQDGRLEGLKGFGPKTLENIQHGIELMQQSGDRVGIGVAMDLAEELVAELSALPGVQRCTFAGSLRRMAETIGDIDILVAAEDSGPIMEAFRTLPLVQEILGSGETKTSIRTTRGLQVDLRVISPNVWGAALQYFTGSKAHNIRIREMAVRKKLKLSEYGLFEAESGDLIVAETEEQVYEHLGLPWIPPVLREDRGEVDAALKGTLPALLAEGDLRGDLHTHTDLTDGLATLEQMVEAAAARGYEYYAVTDHAPNLYMQRMTDQAMLAQRDQLRALQSRYPQMTLLHGSELNIDPDGGVDWGPEFLEGFDGPLVASVHSHFNQSRDEMTRRIVTACQNPFVNIIGHPTARLIGRRPPIDYDLDAVFEAAARTGTALEINSFPDRLDLRDEHILWARRHGVRFAVDTDSHSTLHLALMRYGVATAGRGWLTREDVINAWPLDQLEEFLRKGRS
ncbi:MAG TPA: DNA polymerase/3'-5' exonuclease PolX [Actinobacteria bacterium]|jgi:DNA polymerase (family 10)|nr:DNA polymerase/3'-5' exonuclease PolX [Actinomycetota bacterium]HCP62744.1 DNA polymerase/3'-5' exonuclease PolX [Actinomycetota bacterium]